MADKLLTTREAAELLGVHPGTLENWRAAGEGPPWLRLRARLVRYSEKALEQWAAAGRNRPSTGRPKEEDKDDA